MKKCRSSFLLKLFWFCYSLHLLNFSIDTSALLKENQTAEFGYNYQESIVEFLVETVIGEEDFFEELNQGTEDDSERNKPFKPILFISYPSHPTIVANSPFDKRSVLDYFAFQFNSIITGVDSPPPEICWS